MKPNSIIKTVIWGCVIVFLTVWSVPAMSEVIVIANKNVPVSSISRNEVSDIFLGKKTLWNKDSKIVLTALKGGDVHDSFLREFVGKTAAQFNNYWNQKLFTGTGTPPTPFKTEKELVDYVSKTSGAVGYIDSATPHDNVKTITIR